MTSINDTTPAHYVGLLKAKWLGWNGEQPRKYVCDGQ